MRSQTDYWLQTHRGHRFYPLDPQPEDIEIEDIAHALSHTCRFGGHTKNFYSVAQHSLLVAAMLPPNLSLEGLLHDAAEAHVGDMVLALKYAPGMANYKEIEKGIMAVIAAKFDLSFPFDPKIKEVDNRILMTEKRDVLLHDLDWELDILPYQFLRIQTGVSPEKIKETFLESFHDLNKNRLPHGY